MTSISQLVCPVREREELAITKDKVQLAKEQEVQKHEEQGVAAMRYSLDVSQFYAQQCGLFSLADA